MAGFSQRWLALAPRAGDGSALEIWDVQAIADPRSDGDLGLALGRELRRNYIDQDALASVLDALGAGRLGEHLRTHKFPQRKNIRHGDFGEAMSGAVFRHLLRYCVPVLKLRFKHAPDQPVQGADVVAFRFTSAVPVVALPEVKTSAGRDRQLAQRAIASLNRLMNRMGESITFVHDQVARSNPTLASRVAALLDSEACAIERHIVLVTDADAWSDDVLEAVADDIDEPTSATVIHLPELASLVEFAYEAAKVPPDGGSTQETVA